MPFLFLLFTTSSLRRLWSWPAEELTEPSMALNRNLWLDINRPALLSSPFLDPNSGLSFSRREGVRCFETKCESYDPEFNAKIKSVNRTNSNNLLQWLKKLQKHTGKGRTWRVEMDAIRLEDDWVLQFHTWDELGLRVLKMLPFVWRNYVPFVIVGLKEQGTC